MYYEKQILPIDKEGHFLLAIHYPQHKIGGEISRESMHAYFGYGHVDQPQALKDITALCCVKREPSSKEAEYLLHLSKMQYDLVRQYQDSPSAQKHYLQYAWQFGYQAKLAEADALYVPRTVLASRSGSLAVGLHIENETGVGSGMLRFVDVFAENVLAQHTEQQPPQASAICRPHAISSDGKSIIMTDRSRQFVSQGITFIEESVPQLKSGVSLNKPMPVAIFRFIRGMWAAIDQTIWLIEPGSGKLINSLPLPKGAIVWTAHVAADLPFIVFAGDKGQILLLDINSGSVKSYFPHRGCKRDDFAKVQLSDSGKYLVSRILRQKAVMVTRLDDGVSWQAGELQDQSITEIEHVEGRSQSQIPAALAFVGDRLLVSDLDSVRELDISEPREKAMLFISEQGRPGARIPIKIPSKPTIDKIIKAAKLERLGVEIKQYYSPAVKISSKKSKRSGWAMPGKQGAPDLGASRFGGWPDLPQSADWPTWQGRPMSFLAQINLAEVCATQPDVRLPKQGLLLFFVGCNKDSYDNQAAKCETYMIDLMLGTDVKNKDGWKVLFVESERPLARTVYKARPAPELFAPCALQLTRGGMALPDEKSAAYENLAFNQEERDNYNEAVDLLSSDTWKNQLMGYPNLLQFTPPDMQCQLASTGRDPFTFPEEGTDEYRELVSQASEWGLLLQLTSDDNPGFLWGDAGHLYFYGKLAQMERGDFSNIWLNFEN